MLTNLFMAIVDKSIMGAMAIVVVFIVRMLLGKAPKKYSYILWAVIGIRLLCPGNIGMPSSFSVYNLIKLPNNTVYTEEKGNKTAQQNTKNTNTEFSTGKETVTKKNIDFQNTEKKSSEGIQTQKTEQGKNPPKSVQKGETSGTFMNPVNDREKASNLNFYGIATVGAYLWIAGGVLFILWNSVLMYRLKKRVAKAVRFQKNVFECEGIPTPFVLGLFSPKIYIPFHMGEKERQYVIAHEQYHIKRKDYVFKMIGFLLCVVYWFNPFVWIGYFLMIRDMEMSCDEYVLKTAKEDIRKAYSESLLGFATNRRNITAGMLAFGESDTRRRVKHVMKFKKAGKWIGILAVVAIMAVGVCCLTDAKNGSRTQKKVVWNLGDSTKEAMKKIVDFPKKYVVISVKKVGEYELSLVYYGTENINKEPKDNYFVSDYTGEGNAAKKFALLTSKKGKLVDKIDLERGMIGKGKMSFPAKGVSISLEDYNGNGDKTDFALGQGQSELVMVGNYMSYGFFGIDHDGAIHQYNTSTDDHKTITTTPGEYSPTFQCKDGQVIYKGLTENGVENTSTSVVLKITNQEVKNKKMEPEQSIYKKMQDNVVKAVEKELEEKGIWTISYDETDNTITYSLGNDAYDPTLRLDYTCDQKGNLQQYVSKDYGFVAQLPRESSFNENSNITDVVKKFAKDYWNIPLSFDNKKQENSKKNEIVMCNQIQWNQWDDETHRCFKDGLGNCYVVDTERKMVIYGEMGEETRKEQNNGSLPKDEVASKDIIPGTPSVSLQASSGADGSRLYYASEKRIIFGGYYGLFVYDTQKRNFVGKVDLKEIGCDATQGDDACIVSVKKDGTRVYLQKVSEKETMYVYHVRENRITKEKNSLKKKELFSGVGEDMTSAVYEGKRGKGKVQLRNSWKTIGELGYSDSGKSNLVFPLFLKEEYKNANFWNPSHIQNLTKAEMTYNGIHYVCTDKKVLKRMEKALGNAKKEKGVSNCPFDDVMYLTRKDGSVGMIIPATDDCNSCLMENGCYTYQVKDGEFHFQQMLEKGELKRFQADKEKESV